MLEYENQVIENEELTITGRDAVVLGPNLTCKNCRLLFNIISQLLTITSATFNKCTFEISRLKNFGWNRAFLKDCVFRGKIVSHDFGHWPEYYGPHGGIEGCDFTQAITDGLRFFGCDMGTIKLPKWPFFTVLHPGKKLEKVKRIKWPGKLAGWAEEVAFDEPKEVVGVTQWAPAVVKNFGGTEEELRQILEQVGDVLM